MSLQDKSSNFLKRLNSSKNSLLPKKDRIVSKNSVNYNIVNINALTKLKIKYELKEKQIDYLEMKMKNYY